MEENDINIVSLHGYNTSHNSGFEEAMLNAFSKKYNFECVNLLGHAPGRDSAEIRPISDVILDGVEKIKNYSDENTVLIGTCFGAYPILEYLKNGGEASAAVFVKPLVDLKHSFAQYNLGRKTKKALQIEGALKEYDTGSVSKPFNLGLQSLFFVGEADGIVGGLDFQKKRINGDSLEFVTLRGLHCDHDDKDIGRVVGKVGSFLEQIERSNVTYSLKDKIDLAYTEAWANNN